MRLRLVFAALFGVFAFVAPADAQNAPWAALVRWVDAIEAHEAGRNDSAVRAIAQMPGADFESAFKPMVTLLGAAFIVEDRPRAFDELFASFVHKESLTPTDRATLASLVERVAKPALNRFLKRAVIAHTDAALFYPGSQLTAREGIGHLTSDGRAEGDLERPWHWMLARDFLHLVLETEPEDEDTRLWFRGLANYFWAERNFTEGLPHLRKAIELFPRDPELQFVRGLIHESQSASQIQAAVAEQQARVSRVGMIYIPSVGSARAEQRQAEDAFRIALAGDPAHLEARLRLSHLLTLDGRYEEAAKELAIVFAGVTHPWHRYFALLLLGRAEEGRGRPSDARVAYEAASALFPDAQAPRLAISQIDLRAGDRAGALKVFEFLSSERPYDSDPWWQYDAVRTPDTEREWLLRVRDAFAKVAR